MVPVTYWFNARYWRQVHRSALDFLPGTTLGYVSLVDTSSPVSKERTDAR
jgi:hypothetical protein